MNYLNQGFRNRHILTGGSRIFEIYLYPPENALKFKLLERKISTTLLILGFSNNRENYIKTGQKKKEIHFYDLTDLACLQPLTLKIFKYLFLEL